MKRIIFIIFLITKQLTVLAGLSLGSGSDSDTLRIVNSRHGGGGDVDDARVVDIRKNGGSRILTFSTLNSLDIGDYLQIDNNDEYVIKTVSRHLIIDDFNLVNMFRDLKIKFEYAKQDLFQIDENATVNDVFEQMETSIKPFEVDDF